MEGTAMGRTPPTVSSHRSALVELLRSAARLDRSQSDPIVAARNAVGVAIPLVIGALAGNAAIGLASTIGALQTSFADRPGPYRLRMLRMLATALAAGITSGLAVVASRSDIASALLLLVIAFGAGLLLTGGPSATQVGVAATAAALIIGHTSQSPAVAVHVALLVFAGGAGQVVLAIAAWPLRRHRPERVALAGLYRELAVAAREPRGTHVGPPAGDTLTSVRQTLYGLGHDHGPSVEAYRVLLDEAERIRRELLVLSAQAERLDADDPAASGAIRAALGGTGDVLADVAAALEGGRRVDEAVLEPFRTLVVNVVATLEDPASSGGELTRRAAAARMRNLTGQLRAAVDTARAGASEGGGGEEPAAYRLRAPIAILRANLTPSSAVLRHSVRMAVLVAASDYVVRAAMVDRGYWVPLTVLVVLRPDFASTLQRSAMRVVGTIIGLLLATELVHWIPGGDWYRIALIAVFLFGMRLAGPGNLGLSALSLAALVVVLLTIAGVPPHNTVVLRGVDTVVGGALALVATLVWPAWERQFVPVRLGELLAAYRSYLATVMDPSTDVPHRQRARAACRLARTNAQASVDRARSEPVTGQAQVELGESVLVHTHRFIHAMLAVDAVRRTVHEHGGLPELDGFMRLSGEVLAECERSVRGGTAPRALPKLRQAQLQVADALAAEPARVGGVETAGALDDASDRITNSLDTLVAELRRQLAGGTAITSEE